MRKLINTILAGALGLSMIAGVSAQNENSGSATINVTSDGTLVVAIDDVPFGDVNYDFADVTRSEDVVLRVKDNTGSADGWNVTLSGTDFVAVDDEGASDSSRDGFDVTNLVLGPGVPEAEKGADISDIDAPGITVDTTEARIAIAQKGAGMGHYTITYPGTLTIPGGTLVGGYESTLTVSLTTGP